MALPRNYREANPTIVPFDTEYFAYNDTDGQQVVIEDYAPRKGSGYEILTDDVLNSGNLELLNHFKAANQEQLNDPKNAPARRYLDARIRNAERIQAHENKAKLFAAQKKVPPKHEVVEQNGFILIQGLEYPNYQTSSNGCWSISYSTLLKSRGVDLPQEEIRQWRPDYKENAPVDEKPNKERKLLMNSDEPNSIYNNADLLGRVLPNTAVNNLHLEPFEPGQMTINGRPLTRQQERIVRQEYFDQARDRLNETLVQALTEHQSPVSISMGGHYITVTGINPDTGMIRYEDSLGAARNAPRTKYMHLDDMLNQGLGSTTRNGRRVHGGGIELTWLSDLPVSDYGQIEQGLDPDAKYVKADESGNVTVDVLGNDQNLSVAGNPNQGQVTSKAIEQRFVLDQTKLSQNLNGAMVQGWGVGGGIMFGSSGSFYPGKVMRPGDPTLLNEAVTSMNGILNDVHTGLEQLTTNRMTQEEQARVAEFKNALRDIQDAGTGKQVDIDQAREKLAGMYDFLMEKPANSGKTRFENYCADMGYEPRKKFIDNLRLLDYSLGLDKEQHSERFADLHEPMEVEIRKEKKWGDARNQYVENMYGLWGTVQKNAEYNNVKGSDQQREMHYSLALIAANHVAYQKNLQSGKEMPFPTDEEVSHELQQIQRSQSFRDTVKEMKPWMTDKSKGPMDFINDLGANAQRITDERRDTMRYSIPKETWKWRKQRLQAISAGLQATGTGSYAGVSRTKNTDDFAAAKLAVATIANAPENAPPTGKTVKTAVDTVLTYLNGKEKRRGSDFGRERWNDCMKFLAETMPRKDFETYCTHVNEVRGVGPGHANYVGPETFYPRCSARYVLSDSVNRIVTRKNTMRDYARVIAMHSIAGRYPNVDPGNLILENDNQRRQLVSETERVMDDPRLATFISKTNAKTLRDMLKNGAGNFAEAWDRYKAQNPITKENAGKQNETQTRQMNLYS